MKNVTASLFATAKHDGYWMGLPSITEGKEYAVFKVYNGKVCKMVTIVDDNGDLADWGAFHFQFNAK